MYTACRMRSGCPPQHIESKYSKGAQGLLQVFAADAASTFRRLSLGVSRDVRLYRRVQQGV